MSHSQRRVERYHNCQRASEIAHLRTLATIGTVRSVADVVYLAPDGKMPDDGDGTRWLNIFASDDDRFFGSGGSFKGNGEAVMYCSLANDDVSFQAALAAAQQWANKNEVPTIWVQLDPNGS